MHREAVVALAAGALLASLPAQLPPSPGAFTSPAPASLTDGHNILFFGNSFTVSASNPLVHTPSYGGARGLPELVRQIAIEAGHDAPFVKNVYALGTGYDYHVNPANPSLPNIDEPLLDGETWDYVVMQGYSTRPTDHPYLGNPAKLKSNALILFDEVRAGSTRHTLQSPNVIPVLYQTWARDPVHWFYNPSSTFTGGTVIAIGTSAWTLGPVFESAAEMASQVRTGYEQARLYIDANVPGTTTRIAPVGDAWEAFGWTTLYDADRYHSNSRGDLVSALTIYGTIYGDSVTRSLVASGRLNRLLSAIRVSPQAALELASAADAALTDPPVPKPPRRPPLSILIDFSARAGVVEGPESLPHPGRHYNTIASTSGAVLDVVDTRNQTTGVDVVITDSFARDIAGGACGQWQGSFVCGSLYDERAQTDGFYIGHGFAFTDPYARIEVRNLTPGRRYLVRCYGSWNGTDALTHFSIGARTASLFCDHNLNLTATIAPVVPDDNGVIALEVTSELTEPSFGFLNVLEIIEWRGDGSDG